MLPAPGVTATGANEQLRFAGNPEQVSEIGLLNEPDSAATVTFTFPLPPEVTATADGSVPRLKFAPGELPPQLRTNAAALEIWFVILGLPTAWT